MDETIVKGAYIQLQVKYGLIRLVNAKADLCEQVENVDLECPIEKGVVSITKDIELPKEIPPVSCSAYGVHILSLLTVDARANTGCQRTYIMPMTSPSPA